MALEVAPPAQAPRPPTTVVFTDGKCTVNKRTGSVAGWAMYWGDDHPYNSSGIVGGPQTHFRAGLWAACEAVEKAFYAGILDLTIVTDSNMLKHTMGMNWARWSRNGFETERGKAVPNRDLMEELDWYRRRVNIKFVCGISRVSPGTKVKGVELVEALALNAATEAMESRIYNNVPPSRNEYRRRAYNPVPLAYRRFYSTRRDMRDLGDGYESDSSTTTLLPYYCNVDCGRSAIMGEEIIAYMGTAERRIEGVKVISWAILFPSRPSLNYGRLTRNAGDSDGGKVHFAQLCALLKILWQVDRVNEEAGRKVIEKVIVKTNARRFVTSVQLELPRISSAGYVGERRHKARVMELIKAYRQYVELDMYFAPTSDEHVERVAEMAKEALGKK